MIGLRLLLATALLGGLGTACTVVVLGKLSDTDGYPTGGSSGSSGSSAGACSLLKNDNYGNDYDATACSTCIETNCKADIEYACKEDRTTQKAWFKDMKECARQPWNGQAPPGANNSWGCFDYQKSKPAVSDDGGDSQREPEAHNCIHSNCVQGALPPCKQCEVTIQKSSSSQERALLRNDPCGKCFVESCPEVLVECCNTPAISEFVTSCAFTGDPENKAKCAELGTTPEDAGNVRNYDDAGIQCFRKLAACFKSSCTACQ